MDLVRPLDWLLDRLQRRCPHDPHYVTADMLDGDFHGGAGGDQAVEWCQRCGATRRVFDVWGQRPRHGDWSAPRALWATEHGAKKGSDHA